MGLIATSYQAICDCPDKENPDRKCSSVEAGSLEVMQRHGWRTRAIRAGIPELFPMSHPPIHGGVVCPSCASGENWKKEFRPNHE